jgi:hypothetical protein
MEIREWGIGVREEGLERRDYGMMGSDFRGLGVNGIVWRLKPLDRGPWFNGINGINEINE